MQFGGARQSLGGPGWSPGAARGLPGGYRAQTEGFRKFGKRCFLPPWHQEGGFGGDPPPILGTKLASPGRAVRGLDMAWLAQGPYNLFSCIIHFNLYLDLLTLSLIHMS